MESITIQNIQSKNFLASQLEHILNESKKNSSRSKSQIKIHTFSDEQIWWFVKGVVSKGVKELKKEAETKQIAEEESEEEEQQIEEDQVEEVESEKEEDIVEEEKGENSEIGEEEYKEFMKKVDEEELRMMDEIEKQGKVVLTRARKSRRRKMLSSKRGSSRKCTKGLQETTRAKSKAFWTSRKRRTTSNVIINIIQTPLKALIASCQKRRRLDGRFHHVLQHLRRQQLKRQNQRARGQAPRGTKMAGKGRNKRKKAKHQRASRRRLGVRTRHRKEHLHFEGNQLEVRRHHSEPSDGRVVRRPHLRSLLLGQASSGRAGVQNQEYR